MGADCGLCLSLAQAWAEGCFILQTLATWSLLQYQSYLTADVTPLV